ncbi:PucR family transcriptional regulator [Specibacter sp. RAF43]|uniref:PucR family transcriptional regulator n=1 Tax=Specibacter sp. RAF43 TaxID=3233057 RepID=UPI003F967893
MSDIMAHPSVQAADPVLHSDPALVERVAVRWVHSSEVLNIAPLLRGGELLLTGGEALAGASEQVRREYVRSLAARGVAALAVETGGPLATLPVEVVEAAREAGLALLELRKVAPFVGIAEAVNSELVSESVARLQRSDDISHMLSQEFAGGGDISALVAILARELAADVTLLDGSGRVAASAGGDGGPGGGTESGTDGVLEFDIPVRGVVGATLRVLVCEGLDRELAVVVGGRGLDVLSLALLKYRPPTLREVGGAELLRAVIGGGPASRLVQLAEAAGVDPRMPLCLVVGQGGRGGYRPGAVEKDLSRQFGRVVVHADGPELVALVALDPGDVRAARTRLIAALGKGLSEGPTAFAVGPAAASVVHAPDSLREARLSAQLAPARPEHGTVVDAEALAVERFTARVGDAELVRNFVAELIGDLQEHDTRRGSRLVETLGTWLRHGCNTAETARELHLERQSLHYRLQRIFTLLGGDPRGTGRLAGLHAAVRMATQLDVTGAR